MAAGLLRLVSRDGVEQPELADEILDLTLSLREEEATVLRSSSSRGSPAAAASPPRGTLELELPDTVLAMESFFRWWPPNGVIRRRKRDSFEPLLLGAVGVGCSGST